ncbi:FAD-binding protein [Alicyclobacillus cycloheptanicus]|uniref:D-lactate dehydrogenase (cytochrome) n=1 Tax=Alicyclobacillus cycloheptanicus TaxID=1457 RepID=A0ABT9XM53_9BACL|nr:FAD-linked oxidase C-terminal domain-containing protein [Alicyclobacillus cycloheptanicus]MDQ0191393.1 D-lactate dehydrogenase (cytochrome) [Alicyclobacillus cycloheptanicus]WDM00340.1 FAD-binding protein [Alicyclobacillus cycloheptanicus]
MSSVDQTSPDQTSPAQTAAAFARDLSRLLRPDQVSTGQSVLEQHSHDESYHRPVLPDVVVFPESTEDVVKVVNFAQEHQIPVVPYAVGSSLEGHAIPVKHGISLDMMRMNRVLEIRPEDFLVRVQPGVTREEVNAALKKYGLFFPVDPGANASLGGMAATNASGTTTVRYGAMKDNVRALQVVLPDGQVIQTGSLAAKTSSGYNLTGLFVGSEGTLGVITELWLKVYGIPEKILAARVTFPDVESTVRASTAMIGTGIGVARLEFVDPLVMAAVNSYKHTAFPEEPTLFLEFHGSEQGVQEDVALAQEIAQEEGGRDFVFETDEHARNVLWEARHSAAWAFKAHYPGTEHMSTDVCVPLSKLPEAVAHAKRVIAEEGAIGGVVGHVGDGNFHCSIAVNPNDEAELAKVYRVNERVVEHALSLGGTCTGEHGVGLGKRKYQAKEHGPALAVMQAIKRTIDPLDLMNPGKLVDGL